MSKEEDQSQSLYQPTTLLQTQHKSQGKPTRISLT
jgi:hypothetical protein